MIARVERLVKLSVVGLASRVAGQPLSREAYLISP